MTRPVLAIVCGLIVVAASPGLAHAASDAQAGEAVFKKSCAVCHTTEEGRNKVGSSLRGVVGRHFAALAGYAYSDALKKADKSWDDQTLDAYLADPRALVPRTKMIFLGLKSAEDGQNVIGFLQSQK